MTNKNQNYKRSEKIQYSNDDELLEIVGNAGFDNNESILVAAAVKLFDLKKDDLEDIEVDDNSITVNGTTYLAGDDNEMDKEHRNYCEAYVEEAESQIPQHLQNYFDREAYLNDLCHDDRASALNHWNGGEEYEEINGETIYFYQQ